MELHFELCLPARVQKRIVRQRLGPRLLLGEVLPLSGLSIAEAVAVVVVVVLIHPLVVQLAETAGALYCSLIHNWLGLSPSKIDVMNLVAGCFFSPGTKVIGCLNMFSFVILKKITQTTKASDSFILTRLVDES